jgi:hypothetical protein
VPFGTSVLQINTLVLLPPLVNYKQGEENWLPLLTLTQDLPDDPSFESSMVQKTTGCCCNSATFLDFYCGAVPILLLKQ